MNSQATSVTARMRHPSEIAARLVYLREISRTAFWEFCNSICSKADVHCAQAVRLAVVAALDMFRVSSGV
jgi:hypothetical protein